MPFCVVEDGRWARNTAEAQTVKISPSSEVFAQHFPPYTALASPFNLGSLTRGRRYLGAISAQPLIHLGSTRQQWRVGLILTCVVA